MRAAALDQFFLARLGEHETRALTGHTPQGIITGMREKSHFHNPPSRPIV